MDVGVGKMTGAEAVRKNCFWRRESAALLSLPSLTQSLPVTLCALVWVSNTHRPQHPAAHLPLKGRGTDFQVVAVGTQRKRTGSLCLNLRLRLMIISLLS